MRAFEQLLIEQCAPVLAGIKEANLFRYQPQESVQIAKILQHWTALLAEKGVCVTSLKRCRRTGAYLIYVYRPAWLRATLREPAVQAFLAENGYPSAQSLRQTLAHLTRRLCLSADFPHEIGVFLGYPLGDVLGFIEHEGRDCLCCGCWKVYTDPEQAQRRFSAFRRCTALYKKWYAQGKTIAQLTVAA